MKLYYMTLSTRSIKTYDVICETKTTVGSGICYYAKDRFGKEVWLFDDSIEYVDTHMIIRAIRIPEPFDFNGTVSLNPYQYIWGGEVRDPRANSMCARPYFKR